MGAIHLTCARNTQTRKFLMRGLSRGDALPRSLHPLAAPFLPLDSLTGAAHLSSFTAQSVETGSAPRPAAAASRPALPDAARRPGTRTSWARPRGGGARSTQHPLNDTLSATHRHPQRGGGGAGSAAPGVRGRYRRPQNMAGGRTQLLGSPRPFN